MEHIAGRQLKASGPTAYYVDVFFPWELPNPNLHLRIEYDCWGVPYGNEVTWFRPGTAKTFLGAEHSFTSFGYLNEGTSHGSGVMVDVRTIGMLTDDCCPPELTNAILGTEGIPG